MSLRIGVDKRRLAEFCRKHNIRKLAFFGSVLRNDFGPSSDVDVLVEFEPGMEPGFFRLAGMELELSGILGFNADLRTPEDLSKRFRREVIADALVQYGD